MSEMRSWGKYRRSTSEKARKNICMSSYFIKLLYSCEAGSNSGKITACRVKFSTKCFKSGELLVIDGEAIAILPQLALG